MMFLIFLYLCTLQSAYTYNILKYDDPIVAVRSGNGWILDGHFNLVHIINLDAYDQVIHDLSQLAQHAVKDSDEETFVQFYLDQMRNRLSELRNDRNRKVRSIDWIGSAWKWIAGNPDAIDWDKILDSQNKIISNNNHQYTINKELFKKTQDVLSKINEVISKVNQIQNSDQYEKLRRDLTSRTTLLKDELDEVVRGCQLAKRGIVNTNLLDMQDVNRILAEVETLPYQNVIEAIEYGTPSIYTNTSWLLYVVSIPKVGKEEFNLVTVRGTIKNGQQVDLEFRDVLTNQRATYGILSPCHSIKNSSICEGRNVQKIPEDNCLPTLLKGGHAHCLYQTNNESVTELLTDNTIFLNNFKGTIRSNTTSNILNGTYLIQIFNESVQINDTIFSSLTITKLQALPSVLTNITSKGLKVGINYVHDLSVGNIEKVKLLSQRWKFSILVDAILLVTLVMASLVIWRKITARTALPRVQISPEGPGSQEPKTTEDESAGRRFFKGVAVNTMGIELHGGSMNALSA